MFALNANTPRKTQNIESPASINSASGGLLPLTTATTTTMIIHNWIRVVAGDAVVESVRRPGMSRSHHRLSVPRSGSPRHEQFVPDQVRRVCRRPLDTCVRRCLLTVFTAFQSFLAARAALLHVHHGTPSFRPVSDDTEQSSRTTTDHYYFACIWLTRK